MIASIHESVFYDESDLLRRVHPTQIVPDLNKGGFRPSSAVFDDDNMSIDIETILEKNGNDWQSTLKDHQGYSLIRFSAGFAREQSQTVIHSPKQDDQAHGEVRGKKTKAKRNQFVANSNWVFLNSSSKNPA